MKFGFIRDPGAIVFVIRFAEKFQQVASLNWHIMPSDTALPNDPDEPTHAAAVTLVLVDRQPNIVKAIRSAAFTNRFTKSLNAAIRKHAASPSDPAADVQTSARFDQSFDRLWSCIDDGCLLGGFSR